MSSTRITAVANQKGGVGKTTTTVNLASALAALGKEVLLVDLDPQGNATSGLGLDKQDDNSIYPVLIGEKDLVEALKPSDQSGLAVATAEVDLAGAEIEVARMDDYLNRLRDVLEPVKASNAFDVILFDCPPSLGVLTLNALTAADSLLVPLQCEYYALEGLSVITGLLDTVRGASNPAIELSGIVFTMYDGRTNLAKDVVREVKDHFPDHLYETMIPRNVRLSESPSHGQSIFQYDKHSTGAAAYYLLAQEYIEREL